jgi:hypothetical protein
MARFFVASGCLGAARTSPGAPHGRMQTLNTTDDRPGGTPAIPAVPLPPGRP